MAKARSGIDQFVHLVILGMIAALLLTVVLARPEHIIGVLAEEGTSVEDVLGPAAVRHADRMASGAYNAAFIKSGVYASVARLVVPTKAEVHANRMFKGLEGIIIWARDRINVLFILLFLLFERIALIVLWLPSTGLIAAAATITGFYLRKIKQGNFAFSSPTLHRYGIGMLTFTMMLTPFLMMLPVPMPPLVFPVSLIVASFMIMIIIANIAKRI